MAHGMPIHLETDCIRIYDIGTQDIPSMILVIVVQLVIDIDGLLHVLCYLGTIRNIKRSIHLVSNFPCNTRT